MKGRVESYLRNRIAKEGAIHISLLDPLSTPVEKVALMIEDIEAAGSAAIMMGGSTLCDLDLIRIFVSAVKEHTDIPLILFPNNVSAITPEADAIWFMSLMNSRNPYYLTGAQMLAAPTVKRFNLEPLSMAYLIVGEGGAAGVIGDANPLPYDKPEIAVAYAMAARFLGMKFVYLEAGSGVKMPIPPRFVSKVRHSIPDIVLIVGGGIREGRKAASLAEAGADIVVTGTLIEDPILRLERLSEIVAAIRNGASSRRR